MNHPIRRTVAAAGLLLLASIAMAACGSSSGTSSTKDSDTSTTAAPGTPPHVLASTSWVGAIAKLAGATDIDIVAPSNLQHPPDYDPKPSDLAKASDADVVLLAGFEGFATRLTEAAGSDAEVETVMTTYDPTKLAAQVNKLAKQWGTEDAAAKNLADYDQAYENASKATKDAIAGTDPVVVAQAYVAEWAAFAGIEPAGVYGEKSMPTPADVSKLVKLGPDFVFENSHMPMGGDIASAADAEKVMLINFPADDLDLDAVIEANQTAITSGIAG